MIPAALLEKIVARLPPLYQSVRGRYLTATRIRTGMSGSDTAALGAAIQAMWASALLDNPAQQPDALLQSLCQRFVTPDESTRAVPDAARHQTYETHYQRYLKRLSTTYPEVAL